MLEANTTNTRGADAPERTGERGAGVVEWLGISALSVALLATLFAALDAIGVDLVTYIRNTLGI
jgi:hypothetical protein